MVSNTLELVNNKKFFYENNKKNINFNYFDMLDNKL